MAKPNSGIRNFVVSLRWWKPCLTEAQKHYPELLLGKSISELAQDGDSTCSNANNLDFIFDFAAFHMHLLL